MSQSAKGEESIPSLAEAFQKYDAIFPCALLIREVACQRVSAFTPVVPLSCATMADTFPAA